MSTWPPSASTHCLARRRRLIPLRQVAVDRDQPARGRGLVVEHGGAPGDRGDARAGHDQRAGEAVADAGAGAGDDRGLAGEIEDAVGCGHGDSWIEKERECATRVRAAGRARARRSCCAGSRWIRRRSSRRATTGTMYWQSLASPSRRRPARRAHEVHAQLARGAGATPTTAACRPTPRVRASHPGASARHAAQPVQRMSSARCSTVGQAAGARSGSPAMPCAAARSSSSDVELLGPAQLLAEERRAALEAERAHHDLPPLVDLAPPPGRRWSGRR